MDRRRRRRASPGRTGPPSVGAWVHAADRGGGPEPLGSPRRGGGPEPMGTPRCRSGSEPMGTAERVRPAAAAAGDSEGAVPHVRTGGGVAPDVQAVVLPRRGPVLLADLDAAAPPLPGGRGRRLHLP